MRDVAFSCDDNGTPFLKVAVGSLLSHYQGSEPLRVNVFEGWGGHSAAHKAELQAIVDRANQARGAGETCFTLRYVDIEPFVSPYADLLLNRAKSRWNVFTWTPIFTPAALPDATGNVIHFDIDMLFNADISPLFELSLETPSALAPESPYLIACCYEYDRGGDNAGRVVWEKGILPSSVERYFNTGVLVFNAAACRTERTWEKIVAWYRANYEIADRIEQDAWNALYWDRTYPLPVKWNFHDRSIKNYVKWNPGEKYWLGNPPRDCYEAALDPAILHFWGPKKPWKVSHRPYRKLYHAAMRAVGLTPPRESLLAPWHNFITARHLRRIRFCHETLAAWRWPQIGPEWTARGLRWWTRRQRQIKIKNAIRAPFEWIGIGLGWIVFPCLSRTALQNVCDVASAVFYLCDRSGRRLALQNLRLVRGRGAAACDAPATAQEKKILRRMYRNMVRSVGHAIWTSRGALEKVKEAGEVDAATRAFLKANRPAVTVSGHLGCWEILSQLAFLEGHRMMSVAKKIGSPAMTRLLIKARESIGQEIVTTGGAFKQLMAGLRAGKSLGLLVDQCVSPFNGGVWIRFFGHPMPVSAAPAFFAAKAKAPLIVAWSRPLKDGRYRCTMIESISADEAKDVWQTTQRCAKDLERVIRRHPSCWVMNYNFFTHRPFPKDLEQLEKREQEMK